MIIELQRVIKTPRNGKQTCDFFFLLEPLIIAEKTKNNKFIHIPFRFWVGEVCFNGFSTKRCIKM